MKYTTKQKNMKRVLQNQRRTNMSKYMSLKDFDYDTQYFFKIMGNRKMNNISKIADLLELRKIIDDRLDTFEAKYITEADDEQWLMFVALRGAIYDYNKLVYDLLGIPNKEYEPKED